MTASFALSAFTLVMWTAALVVSYSAWREGRRLEVRRTASNVENMRKARAMNDDLMWLALRLEAQGEDTTEIQRSIEESNKEIDTFIAQNA